MLVLLLFVLASAAVVAADDKFVRPKYFFVFGEHRSGASYLSELIRSNSHAHDVQDCYLLNSHNELGTMSHHVIHASSRRPDTHGIANFDEVSCQNPSAQCFIPRLLLITFCSSMRSSPPIIADQTSNLAETSPCDQRGDQRNAVPRGGNTFYLHIKESLQLGREYG